MSFRDVQVVRRMVVNLSMLVRIQTHYYYLMILINYPTVAKLGAKRDNLKLPLQYCWLLIAAAFWILFTGKNDRLALEINKPDTKE